VEGPTILPALVPNSPPATLDDIVNMPSLAPPQTIRQLLDTTGGAGGPFCYVYL
jgi:tyrosinase